MQIVEWYDELVRLTGSPVVRLNRVVAVGRGRRPAAPGWPRWPSSTPALPRYAAVAAYLHERDGDLGHRGPALRRRRPRSASTLPERDHLTREAARLNAAQLT